MATATPRLVATSTPAGDVRITSSSLELVLSSERDGRIVVEARARDGQAHVHAAADGLLVAIGHHPGTRRVTAFQAMVGAPPDDEQPA